MIAYCRKCKRNKTIENRQEAPLMDGNIAVVGKCGTCGRKLERIVNPDL